MPALSSSLFDPDILKALSSANLGDSTDPPGRTDTECDSDGVFSLASNLDEEGETKTDEDGSGENTKTDGGDTAEKTTIADRKKKHSIMNYDGGRATQWARKQLRIQRDNKNTAHRLKLESMFSFLPKKLIEVISKEMVDEDGKERKQIIPRPSKHDFNGVLVMADLVKSTVLSEEMEVRALLENCGGAGFSEVTEDNASRKRSMFESGKASTSSHARDHMTHKVVMQQAQKLRDAQNDAAKLGAERLRTVLTK